MNVKDTGSATNAGPPKGMGGAAAGAAAGGGATAGGRVGAGYRLETAKAAIEDVHRGRR